MNGYFAWCGICGAPGHGAKRCPLRHLQAIQDPFGNKPLVRSAATEVIDPALRDATPNTLFLAGSKTT